MKLANAFVYRLICLGLVVSSSASAKDTVSKKDFLWGAANAAFQVEGAPLDSDWYRLTHTEGKIKDGTNADVATDFWNRYPEDFKIAADLGANAFRISIAWERIQPAKDKWDEKALKKYETMVQEMRKNGLEPVVTLQHFVIPGWIADEGGLLAPQFPEYFTAFAEKVITRLAKAPASVKWWVTFNEPEMQVFCGYFWGCWPPQERDASDKAANAAAQIARAHLKTVNLMRSRSEFADLKFSVSKHWAVIMPKSKSAKDKKAAKLYEDIFNTQWMDAFLNGNIRFKLPNGKAVTETVPLTGSRLGMDYIGLNYYQRSLVTHQDHFPGYSSETGPGAKNDMGWEIYPNGLYLALKANGRHGIPILITENGIADSSDSKRSLFLTEHIAAMNKARAEKVPVMGYMYWSLTDNFEWTDGLTPRFGLVEIDYKTLKRTKRDSFETYKKIISTSRQ